jgi:hypothetical protein
MAKAPEDRPTSAEAALALWAILDRNAVRLPEPSYN